MSDQRQAARLAEANQGRFLGYDNGFLPMTFSPSWGGTTTNGTISGYTTRFGTIRRIGDAFYIVAGVQASGISVFPTGNLTITGFPVAAGSAASFWPFTIGYANDVDIIRCGAVTAATACAFYDAAGVAYSAAFLTTSLYVVVHGWYWP